MANFIVKFIESILLWCWNKLPDECEMEGCCRKGYRGNENMVGNRVMCDYCHAADMTARGVTHDVVQLHRGD